MGKYSPRRPIQWQYGVSIMFLIVGLVFISYEVLSLQGYTSTSPRLHRDNQALDDADLAPLNLERNAVRSPSIADSDRSAATLRKRAHTAPPSTTDAVHSRTTMIMIANFRDTARCAETLHSLFMNAVHPELLRVSIFDQIYLHQGELQCIDAYCRNVGEADCRRTQVVHSMIDADQATGPTRARYETEKAVADEDFCMTVDSHLVFIQGWDAELHGQWDSIGNANAIITVYPKSTELMNTDNSGLVQLMCHARIETNDPDTMIQYGSPIWIPAPAKPRLMSQFAGGFNFGNCIQAKTIRNDPYTPYLFHGEEYSRAARLWTSGYDFYAPRKDVVYHWYEPRHVMWETDWTARYAMQQASKRRVRATLGLPYMADDFDHTDLDKFQLGTKRTFAQWLAFTGIDPYAPYQGTDVNQFDNCRELELIPYDKKE
ncbi:hypothetical protein AC1031_014437 [Aphanomyces cochlioides]|nr:hypothetical protein AC1031_014437 [Aphanomyces cochlioides]